MKDTGYLTELFRNSAQSVFKGGNIIVVNPNNFNGDPSHDRNVINQIIDEHLQTKPPSDTTGAWIDLKNPRDLAIMNSLPEKFKNYGFAALPVRDNLCITGERKYSEIEDVFQGNIEHYVIYAGGHEGWHCLQESLSVKNLRHSPQSGVENTTEQLIKEADADDAGFEYLYEQVGHSALSTLNKIVYDRVLRAVKDPTHATTIRFTDPQTGEVDYAKSLQLVQEFNPQLLEIVAEQTGLHVKEAELVQLCDPELFWEIAESLIAQGVFDDNPGLKYITVEVMIAKRAFGLSKQNGGSVTSMAIEEAKEYLAQQPHRPETTIMNSTNIHPMVQRAIDAVESKNFDYNESIALN